VLPAGPTVVDILANGAFYFGALRALAEMDRPVWSQMSFGAAEDNFFAAARHGIESTLFWPGMGHVPATELVLRRLLPLAQQGLDAWDVDPRSAHGCSASSRRASRATAVQPTPASPRAAATTAGRPAS
jgi:hypothetical protein